MMRWLLILAAAAFACNQPLRLKGWITNSVVVDSTYVDGKMTVTGAHKVDFANMVCPPDSVKADTARAK